MNKEKSIIIILLVTIVVLVSLSFILSSPSDKISVVFEMDDEANTLTVIEVNDPDIRWLDLTLWTSDVGEAYCTYPPYFSEYEQPDMTGLPVSEYPKIKVGDVILDCQDKIALYITKTNELLGNWTFSSEPRPTFTIYEDKTEKTLEIETIDSQGTYLWSDMDIFTSEGNLSLELPTGYMDVGDKFINVSGEGKGYFIWKPTGWPFVLPMIYFSEYAPVLEFEVDEENQTISVISVKGSYNANWSYFSALTSPYNLQVNFPNKIIEVGDKITYECTGNCSEILTKKKKKKKKKKIEIILLWETPTYIENFRHWYIDLP